MVKPLSLYVHIPFCVHHCAYCDFNTYVEELQSPLVAQTVEAICRDLASASQERYEGVSLGERPLTTVYFGGGTPTFLLPQQIAHIAQTIRDHYSLQCAHTAGGTGLNPTEQRIGFQGVEMSCETNPTTSDAEKFVLLRELGFNRLSIGVQAFSNALLCALDRFHTVSEAEKAYAAARTAGFSNVNLDLMFGLPNQTLSEWKGTLERAISLQPEHLSLYNLTLEPGTRFERLHAAGRLPLPDEEVQLAMYEHAIARLNEAGYRHYEVSNFALPGFFCRHNLVYWRNEEYLGIGPGAVSFLNGRRWKRERLPRRYVQKVRAGEDLCVEEERPTNAQAFEETIMLGLRLREGISLSALVERFGIDPRVRYHGSLLRLVHQGLLEIVADRLRLTHAGLLLTDTVLVELLAGGVCSETP